VAIKTVLKMTTASRTIIMQNVDIRMEVQRTGSAATICVTYKPSLKESRHGEERQTDWYMRVFPDGLVKLIEYTAHMGPTFAAMLQPTPATSSAVQEFFSTYPLYRERETKNACAALLRAINSELAGSEKKRAVKL
jgi:hypothetical protein